MVKPSLLRRGGGTEGTIKEGEAGSEKGRAAGSFVVGSPADVTWLGIAVDNNVEVEMAGSEDVLDSP